MNAEIGTKASAMPRAGYGGPAAGVAASLILSAGVLFDGMNSRLGELMLSLFGCVVAAFLINGSRPTRAMWRGLAPVLACVAAAAVWATVPLWLPYSQLTDPPLAPDLAAFGVMSLVGYLTWFVSGALLARDPNIARGAFDSLLIFGIIVIVAGLIIRDVDSFDVWDISRFRSDGRFTGTLGNPNAAGAYCGMLVVLAFGQALAAGTRRHRDTADTARLIVCGVTVFLALGACILTGSRSAILATTAALLLLVLGALRHAIARRRALILVGLVGGAVAVMIAIGISDVFADRLAVAPGSSSGRVVMWRHFAALAGQSSWFGYGLDAFPALNAAALPEPRLANELWTVNSPHNLVLQMLLQGGVGYLLALTAASAWVARGILGRTGGSSADTGRAGIVAALLVVLGCAMVDIALDVPALTALAVFLAGLAWGAQRRLSAATSSARTSPQRSSNGR